MSRTPAAGAPAGAESVPARPAEPGEPGASGTVAEVSGLGGEPGVAAFSAAEAEPVGGSGPCVVDAEDWGRGGEGSRPSAGRGEPGSAGHRAANGAYPGELRGPAVLAVIGSPEAGGRALLGEAAEIAGRIGGHLVAVTPAADPDPAPGQLAAWGADAALLLTGGDPRPAAAALADWIRRGSRTPWAVLGGAAPWDREVLARLAVHHDAGLLSDLTATSVSPDDHGRLRLIGGKPSGNGTLAEVSSDGVPQIATLRTGSLAVRSPRAALGPIPVELLDVPADPLLRRSDRRVVEDDFDAVERADTVIGLGAGVDPAHYAEVEPLRALLGAELAATRKVTDAGALPHCRQVGVTGRNIAPRLYLALGISGSPHHMTGVDRAHTVLAVNSDPAAAVFEHCDIGIVACWQDVLPALTAAFRRTLTPNPEPGPTPDPAAAPPERSSAPQPMPAAGHGTLPATDSQPVAEPASDRGSATQPTPAAGDGTLPATDSRPPAGLVRGTATRSEPGAESEIGADPDHVSVAGPRPEAGAGGGHAAASAPEAGTPPEPVAQPVLRARAGSEPAAGPESVSVAGARPEVDPGSGAGAEDGHTAVSVTEPGTPPEPVAEPQRHTAPV
jgi:electron transfer flavoprotein alpha subunit